jgi:hypothetical protein
MKTRSSWSISFSARSDTTYFRKAGSSWNAFQFLPASARLEWAIR